MKEKWKRFAIEQVLSSWSAKVAPEILFDWRFGEAYENQSQRNHAVASRLSGGEV